MRPELWLDIETVPTQNPKLVDQVASTVKPPKNIKRVATLEKWEKESKGHALNEALRKTALDPFYGEVICASVALDNDEPLTVSRDLSEPEGVLLEKLNEAIKAVCEGVPQFMATVPPKICGFNVLNFDMRFLAVRYTLNRIEPVHPLLRLDRLCYVRPWGDEIIDVMGFAAGYGNMVGLKKVSKAMGFPTSDVEGKDVWDLAKSGQLDAIEEYCAYDVVLARKVWKALNFTAMLE